MLDRGRGWGSREFEIVRKRESCKTAAYCPTERGRKVRPVMNRHYEMTRNEAGVT